MKSANIARPYAKALLDFAREKKQEDRVFNDMKLVNNTCNASRELLALLKSPIIRESRKHKVMKAVFAEKISDISMRFLSIIITKGRDALTREITAQFIEEYKTFKGILSSELLTAGGISDDSRKEIVRLLADYTGKKIELSQKTEPGLIGGFVLNFDNKRYDSSVRAQLAEMRKELLS